MKRNIVISLLLLLTLAVIVVATNTYSGGVSGSSAGNALLKSSGDHAVAGSVASDDGTTFTINTTPTSGVAKLSVTEASGNTTVAGTFTSTGAGVFSSTLNSVGDFSVATSKFTVAASSGNSVAAGTLTSTGDFMVGSSKLTSAAATGNTAIAGTAAVTGNATIQGALNYAADSASTDTYVVTLAPAPAAYTAGMYIAFKATTANTGACTVNVNGLGAKSLKLGVSTDPGDNFIKAGSVVLAIYDGTNMQMIQPAAQ